MAEVVDTGAVATVVVAMAVATVADMVVATEVAMAVADSAVATVVPHEAPQEMGAPSDAASWFSRQLEPQLT